MKGDRAGDGEMDDTDFDIGVVVDAEAESSNKVLAHPCIDAASKFSFPFC